MSLSHQSLPPEDRDLSPFTGFGRAHWVELADQLLVDAHRFTTPSGARIALPGRPSSSGRDSDQLEGFARTFLLFAFRVAGSAGEAPAGLIQSYADGFAAGTDPAHPEAWPRLAPECRQTLVEACSLALGLHLTRPWLWNQLPSAVQERIVLWFQGAWGLVIPDNNWHMFRVIVGEFLASVGGAHDRAEMDADLARIEGFYVGDGWHRDGGNAHSADCFDHYCGWAMHTYPVLWALMAGERGKAQLPVMRERLSRFLEDFALFFGSDGAPMHQGRSLIYRFAAAAAPGSGRWPTPHRSPRARPDGWRAARCVTSPAEASATTGGSPRSAGMTSSRRWCSATRGPARRTGCPRASSVCCCRRITRAGPRWRKRSPSSARTRSGPCPPRLRSLGHTRRRRRPAVQPWQRQPARARRPR